MFMGHAIAKLGRSKAQKLFTRVAVLLQKRKWKAVSAAPSDSEGEDDDDDDDGTAEQSAAADIGIVIGGASEGTAMCKPLLPRSQSQHIMVSIRDRGSAGRCAGCSFIKQRLQGAAQFIAGRSHQMCKQCDVAICSTCQDTWNHEFVSIPFDPPGFCHGPWVDYVRKMHSSTG